MSKKCVRIDPTLVELAEKKFKAPLSEVFEDYLILLLNEDSIEGNLLKNMVKKQRELNDLKKDFFIIQNREIGPDTRADLEDPFEIIKRVYSNCEKVGRNQIRRLAKNYHVSSISLEKLCRDNDIPLVNYLESPRG